LGGGAGCEGHFSNEKRHLKIFPGNVGDGEGEVISKNFPDTQKFSGDIIFSPKGKKIFQTYQNFFRKYHIFSPKIKKIFRA
jgi:hypothetical protein